MNGQSLTVLSFEPDRPAAAAAIPIAPLIDIVFLLICFFMLATQLIEAQNDPEVRLPVMAAPDTGAELPAEVTVNLRSDGTLRVNAARMTVADLTAYLLEQSERARRGGGPLRVVIRADKRERFDRLDRVLSACRKAGLDQVVLRAEKEAGG